jgi:hypothetical protein
MNAGDINAALNANWVKADDSPSQATGEHQ